MSSFTINDEHGVLKPYDKGLFTQLPSWVALIVAIPLLFLGLISFSTDTFPLQYLFVVPGLLFFGLWFMSRKTAHNAEYIQINRRHKSVLVFSRNGTATEIKLQEFRNITLELVSMLRGISSWRAVLAGDQRYVVLQHGISKRALTQWVKPVAEWLNIPLLESAHVINGMEWLLSSPQEPRINPYPSDSDNLNNIHK